MAAWQIIFKKIKTTTTMVQEPDALGNLVQVPKTKEDKEYVGVLADPKKTPMEVLTAALALAEKEKMIFKGMELKSSLNLPLQLQI